MFLSSKVKKSQHKEQNLLYIFFVLMKIIDKANAVTEIYQLRVKSSFIPCSINCIAKYINNKGEKYSCVYSKCIN